MKVTAVILAAGQGTRMRSNLPKVLHPLLGKPMAVYSIQATKEATGSQPVVVVGHGAEVVRNVLGDIADYVHQEPQLGTGHAVQQVESRLSGNTDLVLVTTADMPLLSAKTLTSLIEAHIAALGAAHEAHNGPITMLTVNSVDSHGFGRVVRSESGSVLAIVEESQASTEQLKIQELNASVYCFSAGWLWDALRRIPLSSKGEYYLTDLVEIAVKDGYPVQAIPCADPGELIGINTRVHLAEAEASMRHRVNRTWMEAGVTIIDPLTTYIETDVVIGMDTVVWPNTYLHGHTTIGSDCTVGPNAVMHDSEIGDRCKLLFSVLDRAVVEDDVDIGPFARLRKGAHLARGVHMGNFGEVKDSYLGPGTKMGHFSYIGNATIGEDVNIGAGTITCNFDGEKKHPTEIGNEVFIGSDTMLVAPVKMGDGSRTGAGSVVTKNIPPNTLAVGVPARAIRKLEKRG
jgi:bifunctional UDP-N-acetylglucosamine pyrophosphorylase/glucosamine-1-phosphate N-acetyltransferase